MGSCASMDKDEIQLVKCQSEGGDEESMLGAQGVRVSQLKEYESSKNCKQNICYTGIFPQQLGAYSICQRMHSGYAEYVKDGKAGYMVKSGKGISIFDIKKLKMYTHHRCRLPLEVFMAPSNKLYLMYRERKPPLHLPAIDRNGHLQKMDMRMHPNQVRKVIFDIAEILTHLHRRGVVFGRVFPESILFPDPEADQEKSGYSLDMLASCAYPEYFTQLDDHCPHPARDIYSLGAVAFTMLMGCVPSVYCSGVEQRLTSRTNTLTRTEDLICMMLDPNKENRITAEQILNIGKRARKVCQRERAAGYKPLLPLEVLRNIFTYLKTAEVPKLQLVSKEWGVAGRACFDWMIEQKRETHTTLKTPRFTWYGDAVDYLFSTIEDELYSWAKGSEECRVTIRRVVKDPSQKGYLPSHGIQLIQPWNNGRCLREVSIVARPSQEPCAKEEHSTPPYPRFWEYGDLQETPCACPSPTLPSSVQFLNTVTHHKSCPTMYNNPLVPANKIHSNWLSLSPAAY